MSFCNTPKGILDTKDIALKDEAVHHYKHQSFIYLFSETSVRVFLDTKAFNFITNAHNSIIFLLCSWHIVLEHLVSIFQFLNDFTKQLSPISGIQNKQIYMHQKK